MAATLNFNVGVLGHIDSGKTSLAKALSTVASTACFDKNPQSKERGITIDLGFSSFTTQAPEALKAAGYEDLQFTLVDCPGHASLIKTIIGGAQIINLMILVVDVTKGIQTQTAECLVIGEITCPNMIVVLNKCDLLPKDKKQAAIEKVSKRLRITLQNTCFKDSKIVAVSARPSDDKAEAEGVSELMQLLQDSAFVPDRSEDGPLVFAVDHCFGLRGQGTVMTGTVLSGSIKINDNVEIPALSTTKKVKSIQMFHKPVTKAVQGDRAGVCVTQFDPKLLERGLVCTPSYLPTIYGAIIEAKRISYFKSTIKTKAKFHITAGHETVMGRVSFFGRENQIKDTFTMEDEFIHLDELHDLKGKSQNEDVVLPKQQYALIEFETPITVTPNCLVIGSRLDADIHQNLCRLAFQGKVLVHFTDKNFKEKELSDLKVFKTKTKEGVVERMMNENEVIARNMVKKESDMSLFTGLKVELSTGEKGVIEGSFGKSGKMKLRIEGGLLPDTVVALSEKGKGKGKAKAIGDPELSQEIKVYLHFKRFLFDPKKKMLQT